MFEWSPNIAINLRNSEKALEFYQNVLGMKFLGKSTAGCEANALQMGGCTLYADPCTLDEEVHVGKVFFEFKVAHLQEAVNRLKDEGCQIGLMTEGQKFRGHMVTDPYGMRFHVFEVTELKPAT